MKLSNEEVFLLQDIVGNGSLSLKHIHKCISAETDTLLLIDVLRLGNKLSVTAETILQTHNPLSFRKKT